MNRSDFQKLANIRIQDAQVLLKTGVNSSGAYYLAGYAVECALKACIAKTTKEGDWPPTQSEVQKMYTHSLKALLDLAISDEELNKSKTNVALTAHLAVVKDWSEQKRYEESTQLQAETLIIAITDTKDGVLPWIQQYW